MLALEDDWTVLRPSHVESAGGATLTLLDDGSVLATGKNPQADSYSLGAKTDRKGIAGLRLEALSDPSLPHNGPGRDEEGNYFLSGVELTAAPADKPDAAEKIKLTEAVADESRRGYEIKFMLTQEGGLRGWAIESFDDPAPPRRQAVPIPEKPFGFERGTLLAIRLKHEMRFAARNLGRFRLSVTGSEKPKTIVDIPARLRPTLAIPTAQRTEEQKDALAAAYRAVAPSLQPIRDRIAELEKSLKDLGIPTAGVMHERAGYERPFTFVRIRGSFTSQGDKVYAAVPAVLNPLPEDQMPNRLGLANWLVSDENPLTARVTVNHFWEQLFGRGIVETSEDFGTQGQRPTHPELLDWLATEFMRQGWSMKKIIRSMVTSATYRQSSRVTPELLERDPYNKLLARGARFRGEAEMVRDIALAVSGPLSERMGGPSVYPYQPEGIWDRPYSDAKWVMSKGEDRYRRAIYTEWRRTSPYPSLINFDAPSRELCTVRRVRTNTPLQALTTLNDPAFFHAARSLAQRIVKEARPDPTARVTQGFRLCVSRRPEAAELDRTLAYYRQQLDKFQKDEKAAREVIQDEKAPSSVAADLAAWTMVANVLLSLDETLTKE